MCKSVKGTKILTDTGYRLIEDLSEDDKLIDKDGKIINIKKIYNFNSIPNKQTLPVLIKKGEYGSLEDLYISKYHTMYLNDEFVCPDQLKIPQIENTYTPINYYHIETENYLTDTIIANGVIVETYDALKEEYNWRIMPKYMNKNGNRILL